jgi:hypothetical protein
LNIGASLPMRFSASFAYSGFIRQLAQVIEHIADKDGRFHILTIGAVYSDSSESATGFWK